MKLIIAEKPSLARNIVAGIDGEMKKENGYFIGKDYIVSWAFGHLFSLVDIESYSEKPVESRGWTLDNLPCFPKEFKFELKRRTESTTWIRVFSVSIRCLRSYVTVLTLTR